MIQPLIAIGPDMFEGRLMMIAQPLVAVFRVMLLLVCVALLMALGVGCENCEDENARCYTQCDRVGECSITYTYTPEGKLTNTQRECLWSTKPESETCAACSDFTKDEDGNVLSKKCIVCNLCNEDFECLNDDECKSDKPICDRGVCVGCRTNADCTEDGAKLCVNGNCEECAEDQDCSSSSTPQCDKNRCVSCRCSSTNKEKPQCLKADDGTVSCVECLVDAHCAAPRPVCDTQTNTCAAQCASDSDCGLGQKCDKGSCLECTSDADCLDSQKPRCLEGICGCSTKDDCSSAFSACADKKCVVCSRNSDCTNSTFPICRSGVCDHKLCNKAEDCLFPGQLCRQIGNRAVCVECGGDADCDDGKKCDISCFCCK